MNFWKKWKYKHLTLLFLGILFSLILSKFETLNSILLSLGNFGYIGAFVAGMLFVSTFTVATGVLILFILAKTLSPLEIGIIAGLGAVLGDFTIFRFVRNDLLEEITPLYNRIGGKKITKFLSRRYLRWSLPIIGALIIASPLPDEIAIGLMGISRIKTYQFLFLSYVLNSIGIFMLVLLFSQFYS